MADRHARSLSPDLPQSRVRSAALFAAPLALLTTLVLPSSAWAFGGGLGCSDLPDYARAQGALEGMTGACDMSVEQARAIVAAQDGVPPVPAVARTHHRHHRVRRPAQ